ncbi:hypothetical protein NL676_013276 [Syzygium grande]|nr:hypothetical protein NL676_013276 [Syzygium grande]
MRRQLPPLLLLLLLAILPLFALAASEWNPIKDVHDPHIQAIAKFAVTRFNSRNHTDLVFKDIRRGEIQTDGSTKYFLHLLMAQPSSPCYAALVFGEAKQQSLELLSFDGETC